MVIRWSNIVAVLVIFVLAGCGKDQWDDCITSAGPMQAEERIIGDFHKVLLFDRVDLVLEERGGGSISIEAGRNLLGQVSTKVENGVLEITNTNTCNWVRSFKPRITVRVPVQQVEALELKGAGNVFSTSTVRRDEILIEQGGGQGTVTLDLEVGTCVVGMHSGAGDVVLTGHADFAFLFSAGMAPIDASGLDAERVLVKNTGIMDLRCRALQQLEAEIYNVGNVFYSGTPVITSTIEGEGQLVPVD